MDADRRAVLARELEYHEKLYSGFAQSHFAKSAVRALRAHMVERILRVTGAGSAHNVLSIGCGIGDTEILLAPRVGQVAGIDLSPAAIRQARIDAAAAGVRNAVFEEAELGSARFGDGSFDVVIAIFFLHHLPNEQIAAAASEVRRILRPAGWFYALDPSRYRLSGAVGNILFPKLMRRYQTPDERQLNPSAVVRIFQKAGFTVRRGFYDFISSPLAGLSPSWGSGYRAARLLDEALVRLPGVRALGSNFEILAHI